MSSLPPIAIFIAFIINKIPLKFIRKTLIIIVIFYGFTVPLFSLNHRTDKLFNLTYHPVLRPLYNYKALKHNKVSLSTGGYFHRIFGYYFQVERKPMHLSSSPFITNQKKENK